MRVVCPITAKRRRWADAFRPRHSVERELARAASISGLLPPGGYGADNQRDEADEPKQEAEAHLQGIEVVADTPDE